MFEINRIRSILNRISLQENTQREVIADLKQMIAKVSSLGASNPVEAEEKKALLRYLLVKIVFCVLEYCQSDLFNATDKGHITPISQTSLKLVTEIPDLIPVYFNMFYHYCPLLNLQIVPEHFFLLKLQGSSDPNAVKESESDLLNYKHQLLGYNTSPSKSDQVRAFCMYHLILTFLTFLNCLF
jgi:hypothetical protein